MLFTGMQSLSVVLCLDTQKVYIKKSYIELEIYDKYDNLVSDVRIDYTDLLYSNDTTNYYLDKKNLEKIKYMNVYDGKSC